MTGNPKALSPYDHLQLAAFFFRAYCDLPRPGSPRSWPRPLILCHAVELALKAYLLHHGAKPKELRAKGVKHNLPELLTRAIGKGLSLSTSLQNEIKLLNEVREHLWHPKQDSKPVYTIEQFEVPARELMNAVRAAVSP